jgi:Pin2-interacting protein X1
MQFGLVLTFVHRRTLVSADPRNTKWANNTETFGQKLLRAHGWTPGEVLGAKDSAHAEYLTEASSSHIKVQFREDNMGIGAKKNNGDTCTGLHDFQDLLGRLNGKTETTIETERAVRENLKRNAYVERKFGVMRFVQGGWLVGDQETKALEALVAAEKKDKEVDVSSASDSSESEPTDEKTMAVSGSKKRKADDTEETKDEKKKSKKHKAVAGPQGETDKQRRKRERAERRERKALKRSKKIEDGEGKSVKEKRKKRKSEEESDKGGETETGMEVSSKKSKKDKRKKKEGEAQDSGDSDTEQKRSKKKRRKEQDVSVVVEETTSITTTSTPTGSGASTPTVRFTSRARFIAQKRAAFADPKALAQILMVKPPS